MEATKGARECVHAYINTFSLALVVVGMGTNFLSFASTFSKVFVNSSPIFQGEKLYDSVLAASEISTELRTNSCCDRFCPTYNATDPLYCYLLLVVVLNSTLAEGMRYRAGGASEDSLSPESPLSPHFSPPPIRNAALKSMFPQVLWIHVHMMAPQT